MPDTGAPWNVPFLDGTELVRNYPAFSEDLAEQIETNLNVTKTAANVTSGTFDAARIPNLDAGKITSGTLADARIPNLNASKITAGVFNDARIRIKGVGPNVVQNYRTTTFSTTSTGYTNVTGFAVTITPSATSSKILLIVTGKLGHGSTDSNFVRLRMLRSGTEIGSTGGQYYFKRGSASTSLAENMTTVILDSPSTTASRTYQVQISVSAGTGYLGRDGLSNVANISTLTAIEVAG